MTGYIYRISCVKTKKFYIGSTKNLKVRWKRHRDGLRANKHHSIHLQRSFNKHGELSFIFAVVETVDDILFLHAREQFWLWRNKGMLYNMSPTAGSVFGVKHSKKARRKHSLRMRGNTIRRGSKMPEQAKKMISQSLAGNQHRLGGPVSSETREKAETLYRSGGMTTAANIMKDMGKLTGTVHGDAANNLVAFYDDKVKELAAAGQYFMAAVALGLAAETVLLTYLLVEFGEDNGGELEIPDSVGMSDLIEAANEFDVLNAPIDGPSHVREDDRPPKHIAKDVVDAVRKFRNLIHPGRALKEGYDPRNFKREDFDNLKEMYDSITHSLMYYL